MSKGQNKTSINLFFNYPILKNKSNTQVDNVLHTSLYEKVTYNEKLGLSIFATQEMPLFNPIILSLGLGFDLLNYSLSYNQTNLMPLSGNTVIVENPIIKKYGAQNPIFNNSILYVSVPLSVKYPILSGKVNALGGVVANILMYNKQEFSYTKYIDSNGVQSIENRTDETNDGINKLLLLLNLGFEYNINDIISVNFSYKVGLSPLYESQYSFIENSALNLFNIGAKYCFLR
jgi:hypothetical protein